MPRVYMDEYGRGPLFSIEQGVGLNIMNERKDVMLVQFLLKAILHSGKTFLANDTRFTPPAGVPVLNITGSWDDTSKKYLARWEMLLAEARAYWAYGKDPGTLFPGAVVPYYKGGKKIIAMNEMCVVMFGKDSHARLKLPGDVLPLEAWRDLFYDPVYGPYRGGPS